MTEWEGPTLPPRETYLWTESMALVEGVGEAVLNVTLGEAIASNLLESSVPIPTESFANSIGLFTHARIPVKTVEKVVLAKGLEGGFGLAETMGGKVGRSIAAPAVQNGDTREREGVTNGYVNDSTQNGCIVPRCLSNGDASSDQRVAVFPQSGSSQYDNLVESVIQCLDEKVDQSSLTKEALELLRLVPEGYIPLPHQVGGHRHVDGKLGFLRRVGHPEILFKPVQPGAKGLREVAFYDSLFSPHWKDHTPRDLQELRDLIPCYHGVETIRDRAGHLHQFLKLEDITNTFRKPCIMDVKIGKRVWDDFAEQDKIDREKKKYPAQEVIGFRIIGMRAYRATVGDYVYYNKFFGRSVTAESALEALSYFFMDGSEKRSELIPVMLEKLNIFLDWFEHQLCLKLFATSLLIVYEGDRSQPVSEEELMKIKLVDFAHTYEQQEDSGPDENTLFGMRNFIKCIHRLA